MLLSQLQKACPVGNLKGVPRLQWEAATIICPLGLVVALFDSQVLSISLRCGKNIKSGRKIEERAGEGQSGNTELQSTHQVGTFLFS
jgi:hypothetical protein